MSDKTGIQWTDATWNPVSGCSKVSPGCKNCYAERDWVRLSKNPKSPYFGRAFTDVRCHPERLDQPLRWRRPRRIFVNSMSDLFHESVPDDFIDRVFAIMALATQHTFQVLTKRPERMQRYAQGDSQAARTAARSLNEDIPWPLPNVWLGVSVETPEQYDRIEMLWRTPAAVRFLSLEPLLAPMPDVPLWGLDGVARALDWVIVGGESGPDARPCDLEWIRSILRQCRAGRVPVFVKQLGSLCEVSDDDMGWVGRSSLPKAWGPNVQVNEFDQVVRFPGKGGDPAEWPADLRVREFPR